MTLPRALAGVRVLDFTWVRAGPWATRWLGAFGADIVKIEWPEHLDILRSNRTTIPPGMEPSPNAPGQFADTNVNKLGLTINVRTPRGLELIKRLITISDVVIENFSSRVMRTWGIGYDVMQQLKARYHLCLDGRLRPYRTPSPLHDDGPVGAGPLRPDISLRAARQASRRLGLVLSG